MKNTTRRDFIKISGAGAGSLLLAKPVIRAYSQIAQDDTIHAGERLQRTPTYCEVCFWKCAGWVYTDNKGEIKKL